MVATDTNQEKEVTKGNVATTGKFECVHNGHKKYLINLARNYNKLIILLGSCYENGTNRHCIPAVEREKMLRAILKAEKIPQEKYEILHVPDRETFDEWLDDIRQKCKERNVQYFCTGNREDILDVLEQRGETLGMELINPEENSDFPYHATDIRRMILEGDYEKLKDLIPEEVKPILFKNSFKEIYAANKNLGVNFVKGRQTVDIVLLIRNIIDGKVYVLLGKRSMKKVDFPGYLALPGGGIDDFESPTDAAIREFYEETGLKLEMLDNSLEPAVVKFSNVPNSNLEQMYFVGIYSSEDERIAGTRGGSSQCFGVFIEDDMEKYQEYLDPTDDLTEVKFYEINNAISKGLAFQHGTMIKKAITMFDAYPDLKKSIMDMEAKEKSDTLVIAFVGASGAGKSTAALGTAYELKKMALSAEYVSEFPKELFYNGLLGKYIPNQSYIIAEQYKRLYDLIGQVDYIVTDAGLEISALHSSKEDKTVEDLAWYLRRRVNQFTIFIERDEGNVAYEKNGRAESEAESRLFGKKLEKYLLENNVDFVKVIGTDKAIEVAKNAVNGYERMKKVTNI